MALTSALAKVKNSVLVYDEAMSERVFVYEQRCNKQLPIQSAKIPDALRKMCDEILENKIADNFFSSPPLVKRYFEITASLAGISSQSY
jgi:hypothetical protein